MDEFDMKTRDFRAIYRIFFGVKLVVFLVKKPFKNELWLLDLILDQI